MQAKLVFIEVITGDTDKAIRFYSTLLGIHAFARSITDEVEAYHMPISSDGIHLHITKQPTEHPPRIVPYFAVDDLRQAIDYLTKIEGKLIVKPFTTQIPERYFETFKEKASRRLDKVDPGVQITDKLGEVAMMLDSDGNPIGLIELEEFVHYPYRWGKHRQSLTEAQFEDHLTTLQVACQFLIEEKQKDTRKK